MLVERDPGIEAASDDLYAIAKRLAEGQRQRPADAPPTCGGFPALS
jgi:hypothetical protein